MGEDSVFSDFAVSQGSPVRRWTAMASFSLQAALVGAALVYPLFHVDALPPIVRTLLPKVATFEAPARPQRNFGHVGGPTIQPIVVNNHTFLFQRTARNTSDPGPTQLPSIGIVGDRYQPGIDQLLTSDYARPLPTFAVQPHRRTSVMMEGNLIHKVEPQYPAIAKQLHIEGSVIVKAIISRDGVITHAEAESGQTLLAQAALAAVRQWRYRPYYLNHEPIEVETEVTVNFVLAH
ncbi:MAG: energy transducer TonB [Terriglobales bacterium]